MQVARNLNPVDLMAFAVALQKRYDAATTVESRKEKGQVFTPVSVCRYMAGLFARMQPKMLTFMSFLRRVQRPLVAHRGVRSRPYLEILERRLTPSTYTWTGGGDGQSWNDPNNWEHRVPTTPFEATGTPTPIPTSSSQRTPLRCQRGPRRRSISTFVV